MMDANQPLQRWVEPQPVLVPPELLEFTGGKSTLATALVQRGITTVEQARGFLDPRLYTPCPPSDLPDLGKAADRIQHALASGERIGVWGDFDVDGQTSTTLLVPPCEARRAGVLLYSGARTRIARREHPWLAGFLAARGQAWW